MSEIYAYRASNELAAAWRALAAEREQHLREVVDPFVAKFPNNVPLVDTWENVIGFADKDPGSPPPDGLSRSQRRTFLIPARGKAGNAWRERMKSLSFPCTKSKLLREFGFQDQMYTGSDGRTYLGRPSAVDFGDDGVFVYMGCEIDPLPPCVTAVKRSEFYAAQERFADAQQAKAGA